MAAPPTLAPRAAAASARTLHGSRYRAAPFPAPSSRLQRPAASRRFQRDGAEQPLPVVMPAASLRPPETTAAAPTAAPPTAASSLRAPLQEAAGAGVLPKLQLLAAAALWGSYAVSVRLVYSSPDPPGEPLPQP